MSALSHLLPWNWGAKSAPVENAVPLTRITPSSEFWSAFAETVSKLPAPSERTAMMVPAVYACVTLLMGTIGTLPVKLYKVNVKNGERVQDFSHQLNWTLNEQMSARWSAAHAWDFLVKSLCLHGEAFCIIRRNAMSQPVGLMPVHPQRVVVGIKPDLDGLVYAVYPEPYVPTPDIKPAIYDQDDIVHVSLHFDGTRGVSPLKVALRTTVSKALAMQQFSANFFANSARPDYVLQSKELLSKENFERIRSALEERHAGPDNAYKPMLLNGLELKPLTMGFEDIQLAALALLQIEEIASIYGIPPFMIGHNEKTTSWGSGVDAMGINFVKYTLRPYLTKFENELNRKLFRVAGKHVEFDTSDLERADFKTFMEGMRVGVGRAGEKQLLSVNEVRQQLRLKRVKGGDDMTTQPATTPETEQETEDELQAA